MRPLKQMSNVMHFYFFLVAGYWTESLPNFFTIKGSVVVVVVILEREKLKSYEVPIQVYQGPYDR
jgi:hypothetical protein